MPAPPALSLRSGATAAWLAGVLLISPAGAAPQSEAQRACFGVNTGRIASRLGGRRLSGPRTCEAAGLLP